MRRIGMSMLASLCWAVITAGGGFAQERTLEENLRDLNEQLRANGFENDGQETYTQVSVRGDRMTVEVTNIRGGTRTINVYEAALADVQPQRIRTRSLGSYIELSVPSSSDVATRLRCENPNGTSAQWSLPPREDLLLQVRPESREAERLQIALAGVIRQAQRQLAVT